MIGLKFNHKVNGAEILFINFNVWDPYRVEKDWRWKLPPKYLVERGRPTLEIKRLHSALSQFAYGLVFNNVDSLLSIWISNLNGLRKRKRPNKTIEAHKSSKSSDFLRFQQLLKKHGRLSLSHATFLLHFWHSQWSQRGQFMKLHYNFSTWTWAACHSLKWSLNNISIESVLFSFPFSLTTF